MGEARGVVGALSRAVLAVEPVQTHTGALSTRQRGVKSRLGTHAARAAVAVLVALDGAELSGEATGQV